MVNNMKSNIRNNVEYLAVKIKVEGHEHPVFVVFENVQDLEMTKNCSVNGKANILLEFKTDMPEGVYEAINMKD